MIKLTPRLEFDKYNLGFVIAFIRENESKKYIRDHKTIVYFWGIKLLCFDCSLELKIERKSR